METKFDSVQDIQGNAVAGAMVRILSEDKQQASITPNPIVTDRTGEFSFSAPNGKYFIEISVGGIILETRGPVTLYDEDDDPPLTLAQAALPSAAGRIGFQPAGEGAVPMTIEKALNETVSVKRFGAVGDGVTDDTAAIQAAYTANPTGTIDHPPGTYIVSDTLIVPPGAVLIGSGRASSIKQASGANLDAVLQSGVAGGDPTNVRIFNLHIDGNKAGNPSGAGHGILLNRPLYAWIDLCEVVNTRGDGIRMETESGDFENYVRNCRVFGAGGSSVALLGSGTDCHIRGGNYGYSAGSVITLATASSSVNDATVWGGNLSPYGIALYGVSCQIRNNEVEGCTKDGVWVSAFARHTFIEGNKLYANSFSTATSGIYGGCFIEDGAGPGTFVANRVYAGLSSTSTYNQAYALKFAGAHGVWEIAASSMIWTGMSASGVEATSAVVIGLSAADKTDALWSKSNVTIGLATDIATPLLGGWAKLNLSSEVEDAWGELDAATSVFTPKESGRYQFSGILTINPDAAGAEVGIRIGRNTAPAGIVARMLLDKKAGGFVPSIPLRTVEMFLTAGSTYQFEYFVSGASTSILAGTTFTQLQIKRVAQ